MNSKTNKNNLDLENIKEKMHLHVPHVVLIVLVHVACASSVVNFDGLTAFWSFNGNVKNTVTNVSLFNQHNATRFVADHWGRANSALFVNGGYLQMPVGVYFNGSLTIAMWILVTKATASSPQTVLSVQNGNPGWRTDFVRLTFELNTGFNLDYGISPYVMQSTANFMSSVALQQWNHVAVTIAQSLVTFYLNGSSWFSTHTMTGVSVNGVKRVSNYIGSSDYMALNAYLNDVMLFTRGLSGAEVAELAASYQDWTTTSTRAPADLSGLVAYWTFNGQTKNNVSGVSLFNQHNCRSYVGDRRGRARSALYLNSGYAQIPAAVFFTDTFTTTFWIYWLGNTNSATIYTMKMVFRTMIYFSFDLKLDSSGILQVILFESKTTCIPALKMNIFKSHSCSKLR